MASNKEAKLMALVQQKEKSLKTVKEKAIAASERTVHTAAVLGGGALGGYIHAEYGDKEYLGLEAQTAVGAVLAVVGIMDLAGKQSEIVGKLGEGMLAYDFGRRVAEKRGTTAGVGASGMTNEKLVDMMRKASQAA